MERLLFLLPFLLLITACGTDPQNDPQYQQYVQDAERAEAKVAQRDSTINELFGTLNRISENLRTIRAKQGSLADARIYEGSGDDVEQRVMQEIESIDSLVEVNRTMMDQLRKHAAIGANGIAELQRTLEEMDRTLAEKDQEIGTIKEELSSANSTLATLIQMYQDRSQQAEAQREELNTAYYAVGSAKELRANGVLSREGGVAGIGGVDRLIVNDSPSPYFRRIDISEQSEIPVVAGKARLATPHPDGTYSFENGAEKLVITDADRFWSISRYLVVVVE